MIVLRVAGDDDHFHCHCSSSQRTAAPPRRRAWEIQSEANGEALATYNNMEKKREVTKSAATAHVHLAHTATCCWSTAASKHRPLCGGGPRQTFQVPCSMFPLAGAWAGV